MRFTIIAYDLRSNDDLHLFVWTRGAEQGIARAKREAVDFGMSEHLVNYRAVPL